eukprot:1153845-Pelagomonas_calceolata.AAC.3
MSYLSGTEIPGNAWHLKLVLAPSDGTAYHALAPELCVITAVGKENRRMKKTSLKRGIMHDMVRTRSQQITQRMPHRRMKKTSLREE